MSLGVKMSTAAAEEPCTCLTCALKGAFVAWHKSNPDADGITIWADIAQFIGDGIAAHTEGESLHEALGMIADVQAGAVAALLSKRGVDLGDAPAEEEPTEDEIAAILDAERQSRGRLN